MAARTALLVISAELALNTPPLGKQRDVGQSGLALASKVVAAHKHQLGLLSGIGGGVIGHHPSMDVRLIWVSCPARRWQPGSRMRAGFI